MYVHDFIYIPDTEFIAIPDMPPGTDCPYPIRILAFFEMIRPYHVVIPDTPQFRWGNPYFFSENLYQSVSFIYASMYRENVHAIHITMRFAKKIVTLCNKNRQPAAKNQNRSFTSRGATVGVGLRL